MRIVQLNIIIKMKFMSYTISLPGINARFIKYMNVNRRGGETFKQLIYLALS